MLKRLTSAKEYLDFINEINRDPNFSDPMLSNEEQIRCNLLDAPDKPSNQIWGVFEGAQITGLFVFLILEEEFCRGLTKATWPISSITRATISSINCCWTKNPNSRPNSRKCC